jgi:hypothetical protein
VDHNTRITSANPYRKLNTWRSRMLKGLVGNEFNKLERNIKDQLRNPTFYEKLYRAVDGLSSLFFAIVQTNGQGWATQVRDAEGLPRLTVEEQGQYTKVFEPYIPAILRFMKGGAEDNTQSGGSQPHDMIDEGLNMVDGFEKKYKEILMGMPSLYKLKQEGYDKEDIHLIPQILRDTIRSQPWGIGIAKVLDMLKLPLHMILFIIHVFLDTSRVALAVSGQEHQRQILSIVLAVYEFLLGDWKKCILTVVGYAGTSAQLMGQYGKLFLIFYDMYDQESKRSAVHGVVDGVRTFLVGVLAYTFQLTAPHSIREKILPIIKEIHDKKPDIDKVLQSKGFEPLSVDYDPTYDNPITFLVMLSGTKLFHCSCEQQDIVKGLQSAGSSILSVLIALLGIPGDESDKKRMCGEKKCINLVELLPKSKVVIDTPATEDGDVKAEFDKWAEDTFHKMKALLPSKDDFNKTKEEWGKKYDELMAKHIPEMDAKFPTKEKFIETMEEWANKLKSATAMSGTVVSPVAASAAESAEVAADAAKLAAESAAASASIAQQATVNPPASARSCICRSCICRSCIRCSR